MRDDRFIVETAEREEIIGRCFASLTPLALKQFPAREKRKLVVLDVIASKFEPGKRYNYKEMDGILKSIYSDHALIRRYLVSYGFLNRTLDNGEYWVVEAGRPA